MRGKPIRVGYRRKKEGLTNYRKRLSLLKAKRPRLIVRKSSKHMRVQLVEYNKNGDKVVCSSSSNELKKLGWKFSTNNLPAAYLTGLLGGLQAKKKLKEAVLDIGLYDPLKGSKLYAALKGVVDSGFSVPHNEEAFPKEERLNGTHIANYAVALKKDKKLYERQFSGYLKAKLNPEEMPKNFELVKKKILGEPK